MRSTIVLACSVAWIGCVPRSQPLAPEAESEECVCPEKTCVDPPPPQLSTSSGGTLTGVTKVKATPDTGYRVRAWEGTANNTSTSSVNEAAGNSIAVGVTFAPVDENVQHSLTIVPTQHGTVTASTTTGADGTVITLTATPDAGYFVNQWWGTDDDASRAPTNQVTLDADRAVAALFSAQPSMQVTLTVTAFGNDCVGTVVLTNPPLPPASSYALPYGAVVDLEARLPEDTMCATRVVIFEGAAPFGTILGPFGYRVTVTRDMTISAHFMPIPAR